mmetsp:Transcript_51550/g.70789  ORF Transcript_51550/g.70789 Transcript_51550/m.70789 type:complete len:262 (+) Transcript_51550:214-999(+)
MLSGWYFSSMVASYLLLFMNIAMFIDIYLVLKNPFVAGEKRLKKIFIMTSLISFVLSAICLSITKNTNYQIAQINTIIYQTVVFAIILVAIFVIIAVVRRLNRPGTSIELKNNVRKQYLGYSVGFTLLEVPITYLSKPTYRYIDVTENDGVYYYVGGTTYVKYKVCYLLLSGLIISLIKVTDPVIAEALKISWQNLKLKMSWLCCCCKKTRKWSIVYVEDRDSEDVREDELFRTLNAFLTTSLNAELVYTILQGISLLATT